MFPRGSGLHRPIAEPAAAAGRLRLRGPLRVRGPPHRTRRLPAAGRVPGAQVGRVGAMAGRADVIVVVSVIKQIVTQRSQRITEEMEKWVILTFNLTLSVLSVSLRVLCVTSSLRGKS
ncbi:protein of unknown function [Candidatus Promineifilum breve]|uniref:Uncharacterized protein n=1 Tax=Candidatus Promineifilum breve TaxID=1806508 RepID=A0A160T8Y3_9CHLR|nr:protein of unknown function [Candidatus Promineifilum breve]